MLLFPDGSYIRDIDIEELTISCGGDYGKRIVLTKQKIKFKNTISPTIGYKKFPQGYFDEKEIPLSNEQFLQLSDAIHNAGLCGIFQNPSDDSIYPGANYQTMSCVFDDGACYKYRTRSTPDKRFDDIVKILLPLCDFSKGVPVSNQVVTEPKITYFETNCCNAVVPSNWSFCPQCGKMLGPTAIHKTDKSINLDEAPWLCGSCSTGIFTTYRYCGKCGCEIAWKTV